MISCDTMNPTNIPNRYIYQAYEDVKKGRLYPSGYIKKLLAQGVERNIYSTVDIIEAVLCYDRNNAIWLVNRVKNGKANPESIAVKVRLNEAIQRGFVKPSLVFEAIGECRYDDINEQYKR